MLLAAGLLAGCVASGDRVMALRSDPMARATIDGLTLQTTTFAGEEAVGDGNRPVTLTRVYAVTTPLTTEEALTRMADAAGGAGWSEQFRREDAYAGTKTVDGVGLILNVTTSTVTGQLFLQLAG